MTKSLNNIEISLDALCHNFSLLKQQVQNRPVLAMVKADAYGHGMVECAAALADRGVECFGVAEVVEGVILRKAGITQPVFIMAGLLPELVPELFVYSLTPVIVDGTCLQALSREAVARERSICLHVKVDAGMGRQGCLLADLARIVERIADLPGLILGGILAHFPMADVPDSDSTPSIISTFCDHIGGLVSVLPRDITLHLANSGGIVYFPDSYQSMVRPGISLYGCFPDGFQGSAQQERLPLEPVMRFSSRVIQVKEVPAQTGLGYGHTLVTKRPTTVALIPAGYEDGYLRVLSNRGQALIHGRKVPVIGRISMNLTMFDVTDLDPVHPGDEVVLLGRQGHNEITADEIAHLMGTINYEVLCLFGNLNNREYLFPGTEG